ncbi:18.1 kDa class I heat shock protein [Cucumis sativus]|uniref:SHSP domain-containing protein n=1 Tax=Cucumis sativus TaxID=3659 RepID=A0A0A0KP16_CUCSA|nr:18.1 kDa class I heat shock protein [Cucumis sativus]KGN50619.1 hypothetical protein Csa_021420 [Cucumis sativus]
MDNDGIHYQDKHGGTETFKTTVPTQLIPFPPYLLQSSVRRRFKERPMSLIRRMTGGRRRRNMFFDPFVLENWDSSEETASAFMVTQIDWKETPNAHIFKADLPGLKIEEVNMDVNEAKILELSGERMKETKEESEEWHRVERRSGKFLRRFRLPENVKVEDINVSMEDGILTVIVPKIEGVKPEIKSIAIS